MRCTPEAPAAEPSSSSSAPSSSSGTCVRRAASVRCRLLLGPASGLLLELFSSRSASSAYAAAGKCCLHCQIDGMHTCDCRGCHCVCSHRAAAAAAARCLAWCAASGGRQCDAPLANGRMAETTVACMHACSMRNCGRALQRAPAKASRRLLGELSPPLATALSLRTAPAALLAAGASCGATFSAGAGSGSLVSVSSSSSLSLYVLWFGPAWAEKRPRFAPLSIVHQLCRSSEAHAWAGQAHMCMTIYRSIAGGACVRACVCLGAVVVQLDACRSLTLPTCTHPQRKLTWKVAAQGIWDGQHAPKGQQSKGQRWHAEERLQPSEARHRGRGPAACVGSWCRLRERDQGVMQGRGVLLAWNCTERRASALRESPPPNRLRTCTGSAFGALGLKREAFAACGAGWEWSPCGRREAVRLQSTLRRGSRHHHCTAAAGHQTHMQLRSTLPPRPPCTLSRGCPQNGHSAPRSSWPRSPGGCTCSKSAGWCCP